MQSLLSSGPLKPLLVVVGAHQALDFYTTALQAKLLRCYQHGPDKHVGHADLCAHGAVFSLTEQVARVGLLAPVQDRGASAVMQLQVPDADATVQAMCAAGASCTFPLRELFGERMAQLRDPFGHTWLISQVLQELPEEDIVRQREALYQNFAREQLTSTPAPKQDSSLDRAHGLLQDPSATPGGEPAEGRGSTPLCEPEPEPEPEPETQPGRASLLEGPVGAGKSTLARSLVRNRPARPGNAGGATPDRHAPSPAPRVALSLDEWMTRLFQPDRPPEVEDRVAWYLERAGRCREQIWHMALALLHSGVDVVLELGLLTRAKREGFYDRLDQRRCRWTLLVVEAPRELRRERVLRRNTEQGSTFSMIVPPDIFELASDLWEPVDEEEARGRDVRRYASG